MCQIGNNWFVVGLVAWGIGCGATNVPGKFAGFLFIKYFLIDSLNAGVYVNVANYVPWIQQTTRS